MVKKRKEEETPLALARLVAAEGRADGTCARCHLLYDLRANHEPTALCDSCAQDVVAKLATGFLQQRETTIALGQCVVWACKFLDTPKGGLVSHSDGTAQAWQEWFFDALDKYGYQVDRAAYWAKGKKQPKKKTKRQCALQADSCKAADCPQHGWTGKRA